MLQRVATVIKLIPLLGIALFGFFHQGKPFKQVRQQWKQSVM
ncbi:hypothetical protein JCM19232_3317 [Vibrio ishigakensis]|uniref:Uncharacterized protein n=1 Tax=Vibrio ishigakensis TaxID=1481914 RepID=A0A0B8PCE8_9VIBR|nr:hypothetical protein JCM19232_3317 [Vibrio ishigakensis]